MIPGMSVTSFLAGSAFGIKEYSKGYMSYKVYIKRSSKSNKKDNLNLYIIKRRILRGQLKLPFQIFKIEKRC